MDNLRRLNGRFTTFRWTLYGVLTINPSTEEVHLRDVLREGQNGRVPLLGGADRLRTTTNPHSSSK